jgi:hypothetical protein
MRKKRKPTKENPYITFATALNFFDPDQRRMIEHIQKRTNFSSYFKRLVQSDLEGRAIQAHSVHVELEDMQFDTGLMRGLV